MPEPANPNDPKTIAYQQAMQRNKAALDNEFAGLGKDLSEKSSNPYAAAAVSSFNPKSTSDQNQNFERYYSHSSYDKLGFNPWKDNETMYNEQGSKWGDVWRATKSAGKLAVTGFMSPIRSYSDLFTGNAFKSDYESAQEMKYQNTVGSSTRGGAVGFASNLITNSGYTVGLIGEMALETAALGAITAATGGAAAPTWMARMGKFGKDLGKYEKTLEGITKSTQALNSYGAAKTFWQGAKGVLNFVNPLSNTVEAINLAKNTESLTNLAKISTTAGGFYKDVQMANLTLAEAKLEGASAEKDTEEELVNDYRRRHNGEQPSIQELLDIKSTASDAGIHTLAWNIPTIFLTNKITFEPLLKSFTKPSEFTLKNGVKFIEKEGEGLVEATFKNKYLTKNALKPKNLIKAPLTYFKENLSEGIQETSQEIISGTAKDYYKSIYNSQAKQGMDFANAENKPDGVWDSLSKNVVDQFSGKGFETFASGFLMGGLLKPFGSAISAVKGYQSKEYRQQRSEYAKVTLNKLNELNRDPLKFFAPGIINFANGAETTSNQLTAEEKGDQKDWHDFEDQNLTSNVMTALDTGTYDIFQDKLKGIKTMDPEAIKEAYGVNGQEVLSKIDKILARAESIKENYEKWNDRYQNPFDPKKFNKESPEYNAEAIAYATWENTKKIAIFNETSLHRNAARIQSISQDILQTPEFNKLSANDVSLLLNPATINNELSLLDNEIEVLEASEIPGDRQALLSKKTKRNRLANFQEKLRGYYTGQIEGTDTKKVSEPQLKKAYQQYLTHLGVNQTDVVYIDALNVDASFQNILDLHNLKQENLHYVEAVNIMADPKGFVDQYRRLNQTFTDLYSSREELNKQAVENTQSKIEDNGILNVLFERGFVLSPENVEKLLKNKEVPNEFYDQNAKQVVNAADPIRFKEFSDIITNYIDVTKPDAVEVIEPIIEPIPNEDWQMFVDTGEVSDRVLELIANTIKTGKTPSLRMTQLMAEPAISDKVENLLKSAIVVEPLSNELHIDIVSKFEDITNDSELDTLEEEMKNLMYTTTLDQRNKLGITSDIIEAIIAEKRQELINNVTLANLNRGNIVLFKDGKKGQIIAKGKDTIKVRDLENPSLVITISEENLKNTINSKYSETMQVEKTNASQQEKDNVNTNITKQLKLTDNADALKAIVEEAFADEKKFEQDFINELGCK